MTAKDGSRYEDDEDFVRGMLWGCVFTLFVLVVVGLFAVLIFA